jgi:hypothetical protein
VYGAQLYHAVTWQGPTVVGMPYNNLTCYATGFGVNIQAVKRSFSYPIPDRSLPLKSYPWSRIVR